MLHVKAEHHLKDLGDSDDLEDDDRKSDHYHGGYHPHAHAHALTHAHNHHLMMKGELGSHKDECGVPLPATKPKIWSLADTAACKTPPPPSSQQPWCGGGSAGGSGMGINGFALPSASAPYSRYSGFFNGGPSSGFPEVQTDTPPQTPPNMKLPSVAGNLIPAPGSCFGGGAGQASSHYPQQQQQFQGQYPAPAPPPRLPDKEYLPPPHQPGPEETAFKPFYKK